MGGTFKHEGRITISDKNMSLGLLTASAPTWGILVSTLSSTDLEWFPGHRSVSSNDTGMLQNAAAVHGDENCCTLPAS